MGGESFNLVRFLLVLLLLSIQCPGLVRFNELLRFMVKLTLVLLYYEIYLLVVQGGFLFQVLR